MTGTLWIAGAERLPCSMPGGDITSTAPPRAVWHTVEGTSGSDAAWLGSIRTLNEKKAEPQVLYDPLDDRLGQFMALDLSGRALQNDGTTRTNRVGKVCIQIEVIAFSARPFTGYWTPGPNWRALMAALRSWGIPDVQPAGAFPVFIASPPHNVPEDDRDRATWLAKGGHYSHSQIPANTHGDPGGVSFPAMLAAGKPLTPPPVTPTEDTLSAKDVELGIDAYMQRFYSDGGTGGINRKEDEAWQAAMLQAANRQAAALETIAANLTPKV